VPVKVGVVWFCPASKKAENSRSFRSLNLPRSNSNKRQSGRFAVHPPPFRSLADPPDRPNRPPARTQGGNGRSSKRHRPRNRGSARFVTILPRHLQSSISDRTYRVPNTATAPPRSGLVFPSAGCLRPEDGGFPTQPYSTGEARPGRCVLLQPRRIGQGNSQPAWASSGTTVGLMGVTAPNARSTSPGARRWPVTVW